MYRAPYVTVISAAACIVLTFASSLRASITYEYITSQTSYQVQLGQSVVIPIYLEETLSGDSTSLISADGGLYAAGFSVTQQAAGTGTISSSDGSITSNGSNFPGGNYLTGPGSSTTYLQGYDEGNNFSTSGPIPDNDGQIELATVTITPAAIGTDTLVLANYNYPATTGGYTQTFGNGPSDGNGFDLDVTNTGTYAFTGASSDPETFAVTATNVPEPTASLIVVGGIVLLAGLRRRKVDAESA